MRSLLIAAALAAVGLADLAWLDLELAPRAIAATTAPEPIPPPVATAEPASDAPSPVSTAIARSDADAFAALPLAPPLTVHFAVGGSVPIDEDARRILGALAAKLAEDPRLVVVVSGHADATGAAAYNERLARGRAERIAEILRGRGVSPDRVIVTAHGARHPVALGNDAPSLARNRRVELKLERSHR